MIETRAIIIRLDGKEALVEAVQGGGCGNCDSANGCGSGKLTRLFGNKPRRFRVENAANAPVGAVVSVTLAEGVLLRSALLMYLLPLIFMLAGAIYGARFMNGIWSADVSAAVGALAGLVSGFVLARTLSSGNQMLSVARPVTASVCEASQG